MKKTLIAFVTAALLSLGTVRASEQTAPTTVMHIVTVSWKIDATPEQIKAALDGAQALPNTFKGITHVWTKTLKIQGGKANVIAMEFADEATFKSYTDSDAQKEWYKVYQPIRLESTTFDVTN
ncbi:MAG: Dabb family protein [Lacunisphaera sp.]